MMEENSKSIEDTIMWLEAKLVELKRVRQAELRQILLNALKYKTQEEYDNFLKDVSSDVKTIESAIYYLTQNTELQSLKQKILEEIDKLADDEWKDLDGSTLHKIRTKINEVFN